MGSQTHFSFIHRSSPQAWSTYVVDLRVQCSNQYTEQYILTGVAKSPWFLGCCFSIFDVVMCGPGLIVRL
jgi:hypothetical protein